jgi:geranylgeranyl pyrophosphate synthase
VKAYRRRIETDTSSPFPAQVIEDLVRGELMQLGLAKEPKARFEEYIKKSEAKTASLLARSCHSVAVLSRSSKHSSTDTETNAREYGRRLGIAFQLIDDVLDVVQSSAAMGKETSVDLKLGLATAPVLFASEEVGSLSSLGHHHFLFSFSFSFPPVLPFSRSPF